MKRHIRHIILSLIAVATGINTAQACTSAIVSADATRDGRPLLWKHRDTGTEHNFIARVNPSKPGDIPYVALFNGGDSLLSEAWMGLNAKGFAIMNTASYNLAPDTAAFKDQEGIVMALALSRCGSVADFAALLDTLPRPMGIQANFGVIDANGDGAYFEAGDNGYTTYSLAEADNGVLIRTNFSCSGAEDCGMGYIREANARHLLAPHIAARDVTPATFTEELSRSFYHSLLGRDPMADGDRWVVDQDFIPRYSSSASIVIQGVRPSEEPSLSVMWTAIGYPPCSVVVPVSVDSVPDALRPLAPGWHSQACDSVVGLKHQVFPITRGSGKHYIDMDRLRPIIAECHRLSMEAYRRGDRPVTGQDTTTRP